MRSFDSNPKKAPKKTRNKHAEIDGDSTKHDIAQYIHQNEKRIYNPPVGLVSPKTDEIMPRKEYQFDPHLDPQLIWTRKFERDTYYIDTVSLHVHERIDPLTIIEKVLRREKPIQETLFHYFEIPENNPPLREAIKFYQHDQNWSNRLITGDSLLVMNSLLEKEGMAEKVQMIYLDPPYAINYGSNFQPFVNKRDVQDGNDDDLNVEPEMIKAFRDTWELGIHSYLTYLRERLLLSKELLNDTGSIFLQISDQNEHLARILMDEIFGSENFVAIIPFRKKTMPLGARYLEQMGDFVLWYAKHKYNSSGQANAKYHRLFVRQNVEGVFDYCWYELPDGSRHKMNSKEISNHALLPPNARVYRLKSLEPSGRMDSGMFSYEFEGKPYHHPKNGYGTTKDGLDNLVAARRIQPKGNLLNFIMYADETTTATLTSPWHDTVGADNKIYAVQTNTEVIKRCVLMTTDPGDLVLDPTCGSGTTAFVAERWGRRWITCDTSRISTTLARHRLLTAIYPYYKLARPEEGVSSGFQYKSVSHITLSSIANNESPSERILYDKPDIEEQKIRISGPFTVEGVPSPTVKTLDTVQFSADSSIPRQGETSRQEEWRNEILSSGIRGKKGQKMEFVRVDPLQGTKWLHAEAETKEETTKRVVISFGPEYAALDQNQVDLAVEECSRLVPKPEILIFTYFELDPEAGKDIDMLLWRDMTILKVKMDPDLFTGDLKKKKSGNDSFWLVGQPEIGIKKQKDGKHVVEVYGFDYYNVKKDQIESGDASKIAMWLVDTDYDGRSLYAQQVFFPMVEEKISWTKFAKTLKAEIDESLMASYSGNTSLPFSAGKNKRVAIKIVDDRGIESLKVINVD